MSRGWGPSIQGSLSFGFHAGQNEDGAVVEGQPAGMASGWAVSGTNQQFARVSPGFLLESRFLA